MRLRADLFAAAEQRVTKKLAELGAKPAPLPSAVVLDDKARAYIGAARSHDDINAFERAIGTNDLLSLYYFWAGLHASRSVGRIMIAATDTERAAAATGFLMAPGMLLTNRHVFEKPEDAKRARIQFGYEADETGGERVSTWFSFDPDRFFIVDEKLDYCVVFVDAATREGPDPIESFGWLRLNPGLGKTAYGQYLSVIQHPEAQTKQIAIRENELLPFDDDDDFLTYRSDTFRGSSGAPVFNDFWEVVALHHMGKPATDADGNYLDNNGNPILDHQPSEDEVHWVANEGARTSRIVADILKRAPDGELRDLLASTFSGTLAPPTPWKATTNTAVETMTGSLLSPASAPPAGSFAAYLPLNVSLRVESLDRPQPKPAIVPVTAPVLSSPPSRQDADAGAGSPLLAFETLKFDQDYDNRRGYDDRFLGNGKPVPVPTVVTAEKALVAPLKDGGTRLDYHHFSLVMHKKRRMPIFAAGNVDYEAGQRGGASRKTFGTDQWVADHRLDDAYQIPRGFYARWKRLDFGHLVRREDNCWGASSKEIEYGNSDSFHLTNCTPQHEKYNQSGKKGMWGLLENEIGRQATNDTEIARLCIFAGPIFDDAKDLVCDDTAGKILVPLAFWKVVVAPLRKGGLGVYGFILSQADVLKADTPFEEFEPPNDIPHLEQASLAKIESKTIVRFAGTLKAADIFGRRGTSDGRPIRATEDLVIDPQ